MKNTQGIITGGRRRGIVTGGRRRSVKKTLLIAALAAVLVFAFSSTAFAAGGFGENMSGQTRLGAASAVTSSPTNYPSGYGSGGETATVTGAPIAGAGTYTYADWSATATGNAGTGNSPHGNFTTTTVKCVVCHSVHYAAPGGAPVGAGQTADTLLRMKASDACVYCHATAGTAVNGTPVYNGMGSAVINTTDIGHFTGLNCCECHASVHGANQDTSVSSLNGYLLKNMTATNVLGTPLSSVSVTTTNMYGAITAIDMAARNQGFADGAALGYTYEQFAFPSNYDNKPLRGVAVGVFCSECHNGAYTTVAAGAATNIYQADPTKPVLYSGHRINAADTTNGWNAGNDVVSSSALSGITIAWKPTSDSSSGVPCLSCHDAKDSFGASGFPHAWGAAKMWLLSSPNASVSATVVAAPGNTTDAQLSDGVCLKCHVAGGNTAEGVGINY